MRIRTDRCKTVPRHFSDEGKSTLQAVERELEQRAVELDTEFRVRPEWENLML
jgi:hypothetical protein